MGASSVSVKPKSRTNRASATTIFWGLSSFQILAMFRRGLFYTFLSIYMRNFLKLSVTMTTLYATIPMFLSSFCQMFVWGHFSDKWQKRRTLIIIGEIIAGTLLVITYLIHAQVAKTNLQTSGLVIIGGLSIIEIFWSMSNIGWSALISDLYPSQERSRVMSQLTGIGGLGRIVGISLGGALYEGFFRFQYDGWGFHEGLLFYLSSAAMLLSTIPLFFVPEGGINAQHVVTESTEELVSNLPNQEEKLLQDPLSSDPQQKQISTSSQQSRQFIGIFVVFLVVLVFINFGRNSVSVIYSQYLTLEGLYSQDMDSVLLSFVANTRSVATIVIGITAAKISKKIGNGRTLIIGAIIATCYLLFTAIARTLSLVFIGSFLAGTSDIIIGAASYAYAAELIPEEKRGKLFGVYNATFFLSWGLASTVITGPLIDNLLGKGYAEIYAYQRGFFVAIGITIVGILIFSGLEMYRKKYKQVTTSITSVDSKLKEIN